MACGGTGLWRFALGLALSANAWAAEENLLQNPGFEQFREGKPVQWECFVLPQEGSAGDLDRSRACQGRNSVMLSTLHAYPEDPLNNWNQNVLTGVAGKALLLKGAIRTEDATEASLWVQCWRKNPWSLLASSGAPVSGTQDWTRVEARVQAPALTDYVTVRCVLKGAGKAWFDDLSLTRDVPVDKASPPEAAGPPRQGRPVPPTPPRAPSLNPADAAAPAPVSALDPRAESELVNANQMLMESYKALRSTNEELGAQIKALEGELRELRRQLRAQKDEAPESPKAPLEVDEPAPEVSSISAEDGGASRAAAQPSEPAPPLVPSARGIEEGGE